jgi:hypothetical protein
MLVSERRKRGGAICPLLSALFSCLFSPTFHLFSGVSSRPSEPPGGSEQAGLARPALCGAKPARGGPHRVALICTGRANACGLLLLNWLPGSLLCPVRRTKGHARGAWPGAPVLPTRWRHVGLHLHGLLRRRSFWRLGCGCCLRH